MAQLTTREQRPSLHKVYNLEVHQDHTFYVSGFGVLVHNNCPDTNKVTTNIPTSGKKYNQLTNRGWSQDSIDDLVNNPYTTRSSVNKATGNSATAYFREDGHYVVRDDVTGDIVQMSDTNVSIGTGQGQWVPDATIQNPYIPK